MLAHYRDEIGADRVQELLEDDQVEPAVASVTITELAHKLVDLGADAACASTVDATLVHRDAQFESVAPGLAVAERL